MMPASPIRSFVFAFALLAPLLAATAACSTDVDDGAETGDDAEVKAGTACKFGSKTVKVGQSVPDPDGCNTCTCSRSGNKVGMACTEIACAPKTCQPVLCRMACQNGFAKGADGCEVCACAPAKACQPVLCRMACQNGFAKGADGCEVCSCAP